MKYMQCNFIWGYVLLKKIRQVRETGSLGVCTYEQGDYGKPH
jgi:hypothetical protein